MQKMLMGIMVFVCIACVPAQDRTAYLLEHGWGIQNIDLVPLPDQPITFRSLPEYVNDRQVIKASFSHLENDYQTYSITDTQIEPIGNDPNSLGYELLNEGRALQLTLARFNILAGYFIKVENNDAALDNLTLEGVWQSSESPDMFREYRYVDSSEHWDFALSVADGHPGVWPKGTHLVRWIDENTLETDDTFGNRIVFEVIEEHRMMREDQFWLRMVSPIENPENAFEGDLILHPVLHPDQRSETMRDFP